MNSAHNLHDSYENKPASAPEHPDAGQDSSMMSTFYREMIENRVENRVRQQFQDRIEQLRIEHDREINKKREEIDAYSRKYMEVQAEINSIRQLGFAEKDALRQEKESLIQSLRDELNQLKTTLAIRDTESKFEGNKPMLPQLVDLVERVGPGLAATFMQVIQSSQATKENLLGEAAHPHPDAYETAHPESPDTNEEEEAAPEAASEQKESPMPTQSKEQTIAELQETFVKDVMQIAIMAINDESHIQSLVEFIAKQSDVYKQNSIPLDTNVWVSIAANLANYSQENGIKAAQLANVIMPILEKLVTKPMYRTMLKTMPASSAADMLFASVNIDPPKATKTLIVEVVKIIKKEL